ncbi:MAG: glycolate oxidase subunit GlcE [Gammaproteobacteria bacterium]|jgi:glycolate oxidase FAD binding subunit|nr:glycolate oxidase subunit GlcE [Gammaproteobacteria bacterium]
MRASIPDVDIEAELALQIAAVAASGGAVEIIGGGSKKFYGEALDALAIEVGAHSGVIDYDPAELVITLRSGCRLSEVEALLAENRQMFGFEPPHFAPAATIGGMVASGLAGPRRGFTGSIRDFVLGAKLLDGRGDVLQFGGRVIKNVAGFDVSRLLVGSLGTLGVLLEVSIRVVPMFATEATLAFEHATADAHIRWVNELGSQPYPLSASAWHAGTSRLRLSGSEQGVVHAMGELGGEREDYDWAELREQSHTLFAPVKPLTRVSLPSASPDFSPGRAQIIEWGGAQRWLSGEVNIAALRERASQLGGSVCAFRDHAPGVAVFQPLPPAMLKLQRNIKSSFDPAGIFNAGRIYPGL